MKKATIIIITVLFIVSCSKKEKKTEQLSIAEIQQGDFYGIPTDKDSSTQIQFAGASGDVILTGLDRFRLIPVFKVNPKSDRDVQTYDETTYSKYGDRNDEDYYKYFMPGVDVIYGYNMINIAHYDIEKDTLSYFFESPVLIKNLYFPGLKKDSLNYQPISRDYFMVSVYDEDTNLDSLINKKDLRKIYHIDKFNSKKTLLIPQGYSAIRSSYDYKNDIMYIYARYDANQNGIPERNEPVVIFWLRLNEPTVVRKIQ